MKECCHGLGWHYEITLETDEESHKVKGLQWEKTPVAGTMLTDLEGGPV